MDSIRVVAISVPIRAGVAWIRGRFGPHGSWMGQSLVQGALGSGAVRTRLGTKIVPTRIGADNVPTRSFIIICGYAPGPLSSLPLTWLNPSDFRVPSGSLLVGPQSEHSPVRQVIGKMKGPSAQPGTQPSAPKRGSRREK